MLVPLVIDRGTSGWDYRASSRSILDRLEFPLSIVETMVEERPHVPSGDGDVRSGLEDRRAMKLWQATLYYSMRI